MAIRMGKDDAFQTTGSTLQLLRDPTRFHDAQGPVAVVQPTPAKHAIAGPIEGFLDGSEPGVRWQARSVVGRQSTLPKVPPKDSDQN
jgi:hypothetical protein